MLHLALHGALPLAVALIFFRKRWAAASLVMFATMLVDLDHLLASPVYDAARCSIGFHPLHGLLPILGYALMTAFGPLRLAGIGLLLHMTLDAIDCLVQGNGVKLVEALKFFG